MNKLLNLIFVAASVVCVYAAVGIYQSETKPPGLADQEGCYLSKFNAVLPVKQKYHPNNNSTCEEYTCQANNGDTQVFTCGAIGVPPNCRLVKDLTLDYPDCCGDVVCDDSITPPPTEETTLAPDDSDEGSCGKQ